LFINRYKSKKYNEIKSLYAFYSKREEKIIYIGISQTIKRRLKQHFYRQGHNEATLVYNQAKYAHENKKENGKYLGKRDDLKHFHDERENLQAKLREDTEIIILQLEDNFEMYYSEIYFSLFHKSFWNSFQTH